MGVTKKTLFAENLDRYQTFVTDNDPNSKYFKITELSDTLTGGKNAFLIQGSEYLVPDTLIKIEIKDAQGEIIYHEPGEGIISSSVNGEYFVSEYYEGVSKVVSVHIYPDTSYGPATITILGEVSKYDNNGVETPIPTDWENKYNVKWQKQINVNPSLANTTKIRFYKRPSVSIAETLSPIYTIISGSKVESNVVSSFANFTISQMETFAGDVKRIKVFRTSEGDISDYDLIQDILVESKELLTSYALTGSVVSNAGLFTSETLEKLWNPTTLTTQLTSSRIDNGVKLNGNGYFRYTSSINLSDTNVYELGIDAFYSSSTASNLGIYISGSNNGEYLIGTLNGITPTKNLKDQTLQFTLPYPEPTASLYLSQSQSEWHVGNISLKLTEDTAFSPSEISFVSSMPTVIGNETYNFKFEFYDVNNNYVPVAVTQSALFSGGNNNVGGTITLISASASSSLSQLYAVSSSISGTAAFYSSSANTTIVTLSGSVSGSIVTLSGSVSGSITSLSSSVSSSITSLSSSVSSSNAIILSSSLSKVQQLANGQYSGSFIGDTVIYSPAIGGQVGYIKELFTVGDTSSAQINLDARTSTRKIYIGTGTYNNGNTSVYLDSVGKFSLKDQLTWDGSSLAVNGTINVTGGNAATQTYANTIGTNAVASGSTSATAAQTAAQLFATSIGNNAVLSGSSAASSAQSAAIAQAKSDASASVNLLANGNWTGGTGTFITATSISSPVIAGNGGYISTIFKVGNNGITLDGTNKKIYVGAGTYNSSDTPFYFASGSAGQNLFSLGNKLTWDGSTLGVTGNIVITGGSTKTAIDDAAAAASSAATAASNAQTTADSKISGAQVNANVTSISGGSITTGTISANRIDVSGIITAGGIVVGGDGVSRLSNDSGFQNNGSAKTGGSVGGWSIGSSAITSNNGQTILYNTGIISLTDGSSEKILITKDSLSTSEGTAGLSISEAASSSGTTSYASFNYYGSGGTTTSTTAANSANFTAQANTIIVNIPYSGTGSNPSGTSSWSTTITNFKSITYNTYQRLDVYLYRASDNALISSKNVSVFNRTDTAGNINTYAHPPIPSGNASIAFSGVSSGTAYFVQVVITRGTTSSYVAYTFGSGLSLNNVWTAEKIQAVSDTVYISSANEKLSIGVNGLIASSAGGFAKIGTIASVGGTSYSGAFLGNVIVNGALTANSVQAASDAKLKTNILDIDSPLVKISRLFPKSFTWNDSTAPLTDKGDAFGFIAQEVQPEYPFLVKQIASDSFEEGILTVDYQSIIALNTSAIKQLLNKIEELEERIIELENQ